MEIILNYLESMFAQLPDTEAVRKARREMASMMEDKYTELRAEGKSENEAIGTVIAEFGSIEELVSELGLDAEEEKESAADGLSAACEAPDAEGTCSVTGISAANGGFGQDGHFGSAGRNSGPDETAGADSYYGAEGGFRANGVAGSAGHYGSPDRGFRAENAFRSREVSMEECRQYLMRAAASAKGIACGVSMIILSVIFPISGEALFGTEAAESVGAVLMFVMIAAAVALFIIHGSAMNRFSYFKTEPFRLNGATAGALEQLQEKQHQLFVKKITLGVVLCILSFVPAILDDAVLNLRQDWAACLLFIMVAAGVYLFVTAGVEYGAYNVLLQKGEYSAEQKTRNRKGESQTEKAGAIYWPLVLAAYLAYSLLTFDWGRSWIIWPVAAVLFAAVSAVVKMRVK